MPLGWLPVTCRRHVPVVYSLHDPRGLTSLRICLSYQSILFHNRVLIAPCLQSPLTSLEDVSVFAHGPLLVYASTAHGILLKSKRQENKKVETPLRRASPHRQHDYPLRRRLHHVPLGDSHDTVVSGRVAIAVKHRGALLDLLIYAVAGNLE